MGGQLNCELLVIWAVDRIARFILGGNLIFDFVFLVIHTHELTRAA